MPMDVEVSRVDVAEEAEIEAVVIEELPAFELALIQGHEEIEH
jgi:hypothetical protein